MDWFSLLGSGPRWRGLKPFLDQIPSEDREATFEALAFKYPPWFFELYTEVKAGEPTLLEEFQINYLLDDSRFVITNKTRQAGGSLVVAMKHFWKAYTNEGYNCDIVSVNRAEAQGKITYIRNLWESLPIRWRHPLEIDNAEKIAFHTGRRRSVIRSIAASSGVRGGKKSIVFDEAAHIPTFESLFVAALPATVRDSGGFDVVSTPMGMQGKFHEIWYNQEGRYSHWARHSFIWIDVSAFCTDCQLARQTWEEEYQSNPDALHGAIYDEFATPAFQQVAYNFTSEEFLQEFGGQFLDETTAFFPHALIDACRKHVEKQPNLPEYLEQWVSRPEGNDNEVMIGIDFAEGKKGGDSTSIQLVERLGDGRLMNRFHQDLEAGKGWNDFDRQLTEINGIIERFRPHRVSVDETGLGRALAQDLKRRWGGLIDPVTFHNANKEEMALTMKRLLEEEKLWIPWDNKRLKGQIHNIKRKITPSGHIQYAGEPHDDMFWAMALACKGASRMGFRIYTINDA